MSKREPRPRRPRNAKAEDCPTCGAKAGDACVNYRGKNCAPHAVYEGVREKLEAGHKPRVLQQGDLFADVPRGKGKGAANDG